MEILEQFLLLIHICNGEKGVFEPVFTYHGFRYSEISFEGNVKIYSVKALIIWSNLERCGHIKCDNDIVNKVYSNALWSQRCNFIGVPTDCPQRDERLGWTGDAQIFCTSASFNYNCKDFFEKFLLDVEDGTTEDGEIPIVAPYSCKEKYPSAAAWGDVITIIPYTLYLFYGDTKVLQLALSYMENWLLFCKNHINSPSNVKFATYGDWLNVDDPTDINVFEMLYYAHSLDLVSKVCHILNMDDKSFQYKQAFNEVRDEFRTRFMYMNGRIKSDSQTSYILAYSFGLASADEIKHNLLRKLKEKDYHITCGFCGIRYVLPALCELGEVDLAYKLMTQISYPSWGYSVVNGATTIWERWNSYTEQNGFADEKMNSFNHYSLGSCTEWMYKYMLGIQVSQENAGFKQITLSPFPDFSGRVNQVDGDYLTDLGRITINWKREFDKVIYCFNAPESVNVKLRFPNNLDVQKISNNKYILTQKSN